MADKKSKINDEIDKPFEEMDLDLIEAQVDELFDEEGYTVQISKKEIRKTANSIIRKTKNKKTKANNSFSQRYLTVCVAITILVALTFAVSANTSLITDGIKWLNNKFNIYTEAPSDSSVESSTELNYQIESLFNNNSYKLPRSIPNTFSATGFYTNQRSAECTDICFQMFGNNENLNFIISDYINAEVVSASAPSIDASLCTQLEVCNITISVFSIDKTYTAYYIFGNTAYQISGDMPYDDFIDILKSIN